MKKIQILILLAAGSFSIASAQTTSNQVKERDIKFAKGAAKNGLMEVKLAQLAEKNASSPEVKANAKQMIDDHTKANEELKSIAVKKNIMLRDSLSKKQQNHYNELAKLKGKDFDKKYTKCMIKKHKKAICLFKKEAKHGKDPELKAWAYGKIPTLKSHMKMWKDLCKTLKK